MKVLIIARCKGGKYSPFISEQTDADIIGIANELSAFFIHKNLTDKSIVYQALTHHYQIAFANVTQTEDKQLLPLVNWKSYKCVSRTKLRHRIQYSALRISPILFRLVNSHL